jgi:hypothetical protein
VPGKATTQSRMTRHLRTHPMVHSAARMRIMQFRRGGGVAAVAGIAALVVAGCGTTGGSGDAGSGSGSAQALVRGALQGGHAISSGVLSVKATLTPRGSSGSTTPITISLGGPFQDLGSRHGAESDFAIAVSADGQRLSLHLRLTATGAYIEFQGSWYRLPAKQFAQLRKSLESSSGAASLPGLSVTPLRWLSDPRIVGVATVNGVATTEIRARLDVGAFVGDLAGLLSKQSSDPALKGSGLADITPAERRQLVASLQHPSVELFVGRSDHLLRRATLDLEVREPAKRAAKLDGVTSMGVAMTLDYSQLNHRQTITTPAHVKPYRGLGGKLLGLGSAIEGSTEGSTGAAGGAQGGSGAGSSSGSTYGRCVGRAGQNLSKLQRCAPLINAGGD